MKTYLVGGAVRDALLGLGQSDRDWVVVGASAQEMLDKGYCQVGRDFPVFLHPGSKEEYALARTERKTGPGYKGFEVDASPSVTLEEDLQRRDLTINAIAQDTEGRLIDPYGGRADIEQRVLRHVSESFKEDPLRVLRVARFAARYAQLGFRIAEETQELMRDMAASGELNHLVAERVWQEMHKALSEPTPAVFFQTLRDCGALQSVLPELDALFSLPDAAPRCPETDQHETALCSDTSVGTRSLAVLEHAAALSDDAAVRFAALLLDVGEACAATAEKDDSKAETGQVLGAEQAGARLIESLSQRLRVPRDFMELARLSCLYRARCHRLHELLPPAVLALLESLDAFRRPERVDKFLLCCEADARCRAAGSTQFLTQATRLRSALQAAQQVDIPQLIGTMKKKDGQAIKQAVQEARTNAIARALAHDALASGTTPEGAASSDSRLGRS